MDTDEQLLEFETKQNNKLHCFRIVNDEHKEETLLVQVSSNPKSPKTEIEDILNGKIFYEALKYFKPLYPELLKFVGDDEKTEIPSYFALDLTVSQKKLLTAFFDKEPENKVLFANKYIEIAKSTEEEKPKWVSLIKELLKK